ncbi:14830_t:CDS:2, partial [Dentiscutata erythropus]
MSISFPSKRQKKTEALQELIQIRHELKGKPVYFFLKLDRYFEGILMFDAKEQRTYIYNLINDCKYETFSKWINGLQKHGLFKGQRSALATVFLEPNPTSLPIASILRKTIKEQTKTIINLKDQLQKKIEKEEEKVSNKIANIVHTVTKSVTNKTTNIADLHSIFQELIRIQCFYVEQYLYINEYEQKSGWQDKIAQQILASLTANKIWGYGRVGFFSHNSFKIQKDLLWSQHENCYVGYLNFEDEMQDYQTFAIQCQQEIELSTKSNFLSNSISEEPKRELATQVHQVIWHSATLTAKLKCLGIYTYGSICDGAGENRTHIKSFDWYASTWSLGDIVEVDFNKKFYSAEIVNFNHDRTQFSMHYLNCGSSKTITVDRALIRSPMTKKSKWNFNEICEFKNPQDNQ